LLEGQFRVLMPKDLVRGAGIECWDALSKEDLFIMDVSFSQSSSASDLPPLATRTVPLGEYWMTGGAALPTGSSAIGAAMKMQHNKELMSASVLESSKFPSQLSGPLSSVAWQSEFVIRIFQES
jgi:hypothetical protein